MRVAFCCVALTAFSFCFAEITEEQLRKLTVHTQVRENIFAGFMVNDMARFEQGEKRLDAILREQPDLGPALAWKGGATLYRAVRAHEAGDSAGFAKTYREAMQILERAYEVAPRNHGVLATYGGSIVLFAGRLPEPQKRDGWERARKLYTELEREQAPAVEKFPPHLKGELLAGRAQAEVRLGNWDAARPYLERLAAMEGTPYAPRARLWLEKPETAEKSSITCMTCHEPGRLENRLAALKE
jgi:tetratricopeptide (TPR) repeat protein